MEIEKKESNPDPTPSCWGSLDRDRDRIAGFARDQGDISTLRDRVTFLFCVDNTFLEIKPSLYIDPLELKISWIHK